MRTIKDPKKKPELRRRTDLDEAEDDNTSNKSTPPKKRKTAKSSKDDSSSLNDSGSIIDNQSDILSERSSIIGDEDISDVSSLKSTPPKKRNYQKVLNKSQEILNGDIHSSVEESPELEKKVKTKKVLKIVDHKDKNDHSSELDESQHQGAKKKLVTKKSPKGKKPLFKKLKDKDEKNETAVDKESKDNVKTSLKGKKVTKTTKKKGKQTDNPLEKQEEETGVKKKTVNRKRKLSGHLVDESNLENKQSTLENLDTTKTDTTKPKKQKKTKKQLIKEEAQLELKRQTEEQRTVHNEKLNGEIKDDTLNEDKKQSKKKSPKVSKADKSKSKEPESSSQNEISSVSHKSVTNLEIRNESAAKKETIINEPYNSDSDYSDDSDFDTSFESINSVVAGDDIVNGKIDDTESKTVSTITEDGDLDRANAKVEQTIKCEHCGYISRSKGGHTRHLKKCQPSGDGSESVTPGKVQKIHYCEKCDYAAPRRVLVINHMKSHGIFQCKRCKYRTDCEEDLVDHSGQEHKDRSDCKFCKLCNRYVKCSEIPLEKHMLECTGRHPFKCPECLKEFQYESSLKCHVVSHYPDQPKLFGCNQCDYKSNYKANLKKHIRHIHEQRGEKDIKCPECDKMFHTEDNMRRHQKLHSEERPYKCVKDECDKAFKTINGLKFHLVTHQTERPFACEVEGCSKDFKSKHSLALHLNETHKNAPKTHICAEEGCSMAFYGKYYLERHMNGHRENRSHFCDWPTCSKAFKTADALKIHMLIHTDEKPVHCEHCEYTCRQKSSIRIHMKKKHPELVLIDIQSPKQEHVPGDIQSPKYVETSDLKSPKTIVTDDDEKGSSKLNSSRVETESSFPQNTHKYNYEPGSTNKPGESNNAMSESKSKIDILTINGALNVAKNCNEHIPVYKNHENQTSINTQTSPNDQDIEHHPSNQIIAKVPFSHSAVDISELSNQNMCNKTSVVKNVGHVTLSTNKNTAKKTKKADMYDFQSEDESGDEMKPGLLRKEYNKDKPILPPVTGKIDPNLLKDIDLPVKDADEKLPGETDPITPKVRKKPGPKPKPKPEKIENEPEPKQPKKRGRKKKSETEKVQPENESENKDTIKEGNTSVKHKPGKRGRSPKVKRDENDTKKSEEVIDKQETPVKKKRGPKKKVKEVPETEAVVKVPKKRGRKKKVVNEEEKKKIEPENGDATINYSEVESSEMFADSKDSISDQTETQNVIKLVPANHGKYSKARPDSSDEDDYDDDDNDTSVNKDKDDDNAVLQEINEILQESKITIQETAVTKDVKSDVERKVSDLETDSSDIGSEFEEDLKPPPAPRPPPMYDSEDGDIESGPENEEFNASVMSNEPLRDFESSREISREISRDFESSREIDDSVKTSDINSVETSTPREIDGTPSSVNPYRNDSVGNDYDNQETPHPHSHHSSVPHTPSHNSVPTTPITANQEYESRSIENPVHGERIIKSAVQGQTNDENTDESSMPEVDKDYVGRFFEEIQCTTAQTEDQITRMNSIEESNKSQEKIAVTSPGERIVVPSSLTITSNPTDASIQMQSPPADLSMKRMEMLSPAERPSEDHYQPRSVESVHRPSDPLPTVPPFESQQQYNTHVPYSTSIPPRETILRQPEQSKVQSPTNTSTGSSSFISRFPPSETESMIQRQRMTTPYDHNIRNLNRVPESSIPQHNSSSPLLRHVPGREEVFPTPGVAGSMARNPFHSSWSGQDVRPPHWGHPTYLQRSLDQQSGATPSSLFGKDSAYLPGREFMFDPSRAAAERNMFSSLASSHAQRQDMPHDTFQFDRFDLGSYLSSHGYNAPPSLPVDYTRSAHSSSQKTLDDRYRQSTTGVTDFRALPQTSTTSEMFSSMNSSFNLDKFYPRDSMYHAQHITDNTNSPFLPGVPSQHSMFNRDYPHRSFYAQNPSYPFVNMNDKNYTAAASAKLGHTPGSTAAQQRDLVPVPRPNMSAPDPQLQDPYTRHHSSMLYNMMNRYFD